MTAILNTMTNTSFSISTMDTSHGCIWIQSPYYIDFTNAPDVREIIGLGDRMIILPASFYIYRGSHWLPGKSWITVVGRWHTPYLKTCSSMCAQETHGRTKRARAEPWSISAILIEIGGYRRPRFSRVVRHLPTTKDCFTIIEKSKD